MEDSPNTRPTSVSNESEKKMAKSVSIRYPSTHTGHKATNFSDTGAHQGKVAHIFGEFNLPARPAPEVIDIDDSEEENENEQAHDSDDNSIQAPNSNDEEETQTNGPRLGALPPLFYRLHPPAKVNHTPDKIPLIQVKQEAATHSIEDQHYVHVYLQVSLHIKQNMPDWPGLMKVHDFLQYKVGSNTAIIVLPSKRRGGDENPIVNRWTHTTTRNIYPIYFQGYTIPRNPTSSASAAKKEATTGKKEKPVSKAATNLKVRVCISLQKFQLPSLIKAAALTNTDATCKITLDPIRHEIVEKIGWITGSHKVMNISHWEHYIQAQLSHFVGSSFDLRLQMDPLSAPRSASGNERFRQTNPKQGVDPIQMWGVYTGKPSAAGLSSALHSLFHTQWRGKVFGQDMQFLPTSTGDSLEGIATMWQAAKLWQDETIVVKSFGLHHIHDLIETYASDGTASTPHLLAYYCRKTHQPGAPPLFRAVESREIPTQADLLIHGHGPVAYFLVHKDDKRVAELFAADVYNTLAYTNSALKPKHVYRLGLDYVPLAAQQAVANAEAAEAFAALDLRVNGTPDTKANILHRDSASAASSKTTASNPLSTPTTTPQRHPKKQRRVIFPFDSGETDSTAAASTLTASETQRLLDLEAEVLFLKSREAIYTAADMGTMLARVLTGMFPTQAHYTAAIFQDYGYISSNHPATPEVNSPPLSPSQLTTPGTSASDSMMDTDTTLPDEYHPAKQAEVEEYE
jgi:hypothetical protein